MVAKRLLDIVGAGAMLVVGSPLMLGIGLLVYVRMGSPILFRQKRPGRRERPFTLLKFRTMNGDASSSRPDAERLTSLGRWLRRTSLDELPSLVHVLAGTMSLVGPRPLLMRYLPFYTSRERLRHSVRPGLTGWAQIQGRNEIDWDRRLALDVWYVQNRSLRLDLWILWRTACMVIRRRGVVPAPNTLLPDLDEARRLKASSKDSSHGSSHDSAHDSSTQATEPRPAR